MQYTYIASKIYEWVVYTCILFYVASCFLLRDRVLCFLRKLLSNKKMVMETHDWLVFMTGLIFSKDSHFIT